MTYAHLCTEYRKGISDKSTQTINATKPQQQAYGKLIVETSE
jgi:hypothetical protein